jgi:hypothetical protein
MSSLAEVRQRLIEAARRHSRVTHEVEDLAHDIILSALRRGRTLEGEQFLRGIHRAAQQHGAFLARTAVRRRAREHLTAQDLTVHASVRVAPSASRGTALSTLSSALQTTVLLLLQALASVACAGTARPPGAPGARHAPRAGAVASEPGGVPAEARALFDTRRARAPRARGGRS